MTGVTSTRRLWSWAAALAGLLLPALAAAGAEEKWPAVSAERLPGSGSAITWTAPQFLQADAKGRIYVLRADTLDVYPVERKGAFGEPVKLKMAGDSGGEPLRAAMGSSGGDWLLFSGMGRPLRWFREGKEELLPPCGWQVESVGVAGGRPVVNVIPFRSGLSPEARVPDPPPLLMAYDGHRWNALRSERADPGKDGEPRMAAIVQRSAWLSGSADGKLLVSDLYRYRVRSFSAAGKPLLELAAGPSQPRPVAEPEKAGEILVKAAGKRGLGEGPRRGHAVALTVRQVIVAATRGRDGSIYLLIDDESAGGLALDRYDAAQAVLERVAFRLPVSTPQLGTASLAAGHDGLYLAAFRGDQGRFRVSWETLAEAPWRPVERARIETPSPSRAAP